MNQINRQDVFTTGELCKALGLYVTASFLMETGITPLASTTSAVYWRKSDFKIICHAISMHVLKKATDND